MTRHYHCGDCRALVDEAQSVLRVPVNATPSLPTEGTYLVAYLDTVERSFIQQALDRSGGNRARAARLLGMNRTTLVEKLKRQGAA